MPFFYHSNTPPPEPRREEAKDKSCNAELVLFPRDSKETQSGKVSGGKILLSPAFPIPHPVRDEAVDPTYTSFLEGEVRPYPAISPATVIRYPRAEDVTPTHHPVRAEADSPAFTSYTNLFRPYRDVERDVDAIRDPAPLPSILGARILREVVVDPVPTTYLEGEARPYPVSTWRVTAASKWSAVSALPSYHTVRPVHTDTISVNVLTPAYTSWLQGYYRPYASLWGAVIPRRDEMIHVDVLNPQWAGGMSISRKFLTTIFKASSQHESRKALRPRPVRTMSVPFSYFGEYGAGDVWGALQKMTSEDTLFPWFLDEMHHTRPLESHFIYCDTTDKAYYEGGQIVLVPIQNESASVIRGDVSTILHIQPEGITVTAETLINTLNFPNGAVIYPAFTGRAALQSTHMELLTGTVGVLTMDIEEVYGEDTLPLENQGYTPPRYNNIPVASFALDFGENISQSIGTAGSHEVSGRGWTSTVLGSTFLTQEGTVLLSNRADIWSFTGLMNLVKGRCRSFWVKNVLDFLVVEATSGATSVDISNPNDISDFAYLKYVWLTSASGAESVATVTSIEAIAGTDITRLYLSGATVSDIALIRQAHIVRLTEDVVTEDYLTSTVMKATFKVQELQGA